MSAGHVVFPFENLSDLEFIPIAARRALDHAGLRLSLESWRSLTPEERSQIAELGSADVVDTTRVSLVALRAQPLAQRIDPVSDPDLLSPPEDLVRSLDPTRVLDPRRWSRLRALDRYALLFVHRRAVARSDPSLVQAAYDDVFGFPRSPVPTSQRGLTSIPPVAGSSSSPSDEPRTRATRQPAFGLGPRRPSGAFEAPAPSRRTPAPAQPTSSAARNELTHVDRQGAVRMVDVAAKPTTHRRATARATVLMRPETAARMHDTPKGSVLAAARIAGIQAAKKTSELIPLCHQVPLTSVSVDVDVDVENGVVFITTAAEATHRTGVEMEALVAASIAGLTIYDMLKAIDRDIAITDVQLVEKDGGASGPYRREGT
jgi:cyclic pyranopterin phosphate synthase